MSGTWSDRLAELNITLPEVVPPLAAYVPATQVGDLVYTAGQLPMRDGELVSQGKVSENAEGIVHLDDAVFAARQCALNALAAVHALVGIDSVKRIVKVTGFVASAKGFSNQAAVLNGASLLLGEIFGDAGVHVRSAVGVAELPLGAPVEVELTVQV
ncbi:Endoribonuclease L-PSP OS=Tsukamurella paurometabola (strain ATCC 8368 / DSM / CCUG 35730 /CIP 100753 / JCM 10117 / KCTC 9821 / NBRC 16120 / NCIMB 702349/ NCTC 13040) OX=521096 GN=Tpau_3934 PE=4 SV=1 [Tsukamurella paurometabola]|uniref:Endoribonuclease L-PSP n=1 Tax=Tsukamurella paurometabola (strain ATCC 8368 / DSM 20162 / CCUG 35730 / CIP 100753 / JCM 10117 / KCTC 9821 / NBRC 16120 / NCIMB 702349 / NCTC 13040) TaxID=521096 RepID=D5UMN2_TSUPD|nr:RidA family protein [Tsukamurella paurometabola]ADG80506.1 Endoribonuclease L-PSP [Tsukamurella paurometabola DSM 20162]SUP39899.1 putative endoribonuclease L-PSP [Tsukamurella paurometabola]